MLDFSVVLVNTQHALQKSLFSSLFFHCSCKNTFLLEVPKIMRDTVYIELSQIKMLASL